MKKITINIPIYFCKLTVIICTDTNLVAKKYGITSDVSKLSGFSMRDPKKSNHYLIVMEDSDRSVLVHELVHIVNYIYIDSSMELDRYNDEPQAYLIGWLYKKVDKFLKRVV